MTDSVTKRLEAAIRLLYPEEMTPIAKRILERVISDIQPITPEMVEAGAAALVQAETNGLCQLGKICEMCDCFLKYEPENTDRDHYARANARAVLEAALRL